ncbi:MAG TPA: hypothetical protein VE422_21725 [Terriglobia bacterium]|nr:hypothetical protein [Terriglobia bacterium]
MFRVFVLGLFVPVAAFGQTLNSTQHVFPWFAHGRTASGGTYRTELILSNPNPTFANCSLHTAGFSVRLEGLNGALPFPASTVTFAIFPAGYEVIRSIGDQPLVSGFAVLTCAQPIFATSNFSFFSSPSDRNPAAEANVPSSIGGRSIEYVFDRRSGARLAIAIANPYPTTATYNFNVVGSVTVTFLVLVPAGGVIARFLDELVALPPNATGKVIVSDSDFSRNIYSIGLKFSGDVFSSAQPNVLLP